MSEHSKIEWTEATWNPVRGCTKISPGCKHCYAETFAERFRGVPEHPYADGFDPRLIPDKLLEPIRWESSRTVFVNSMSDLFQDPVPDKYGRNEQSASGCSSPQSYMRARRHGTSGGA
jgi:protein gp37